ncbi:uncharacterized protein BDW70DRAFT_169479 [Aspergillus foveolatus]|uniref:uncharacterized protein n=1 Tax=Aspergillus foveolatus TaxID=210207 RepID=UPI003CCE17E8
MDFLNSRITFASMHAFEDVGVRELEEDLSRSFPQAGSHCEYSKAEDVLVIRGKLEGLAAKTTVFVCSFIERNSNSGDLLELSTGVREECPLVDDTDNSHDEGLLMSDDDPVRVVPHAFTQGVGCFAHEKHREMLGELARHTGTEIAIIDEIKGLQVSGGNEGDVNDALERPSRIETPLSCLGNPDIKNIAVGLTESGKGWMTQAYEDLHPEAPHHSLYLNEETGMYTPAKNLVEPPRCRHANKKSRIWSDFFFQEIGDGANFLALGLTAGIIDTETQFVLSGVIDEHPHLSSEKNKYVSEWVNRVNGLDMGVTEAALKSETPAGSLHSAGSATKLPPHPGVKKAPGIKVRRPIQFREDAIRSVPDAASLALPRDSNGLTMSSQKRWKWEYHFDASGTTNGHAAVAKVENYISNDGPSSIKSAANSLKPKSMSHYPNEPGPASLRPSMAAASASNIVTTKSKFKGPLSEPHAKPAPRKDHLINVNAAVKHTDVGLSTIRLEMAGLIPPPSVSPGGRSVPSPGVDPMTFASGELAVLRGSHVAKLTSVCGSNAPSSLVNEVPKEKQDARLESLYHKCSRHYAETTQNPPARPNETKSRKYYRTMTQKAAKPGQKAKRRTSSLAKKQATLEDACEISSQKKSVDKLQGVDVPSGKGPKTPVAADTERRLDFGIFIVALKPIFKAAEAFPGIATFEIQFGLALIPLMPKTRNTNMISSTEWSEIFQPRNGTPTPTTKFVNRLTACGSEIDHIIDLRKSKAEGKSRMFEEEYSEYNICYEFHCRSNTEELLLINQKLSLGAVPPSQNICIYTSLPRGSKMIIEKVVMKRWTRNRFLRPGEGMRNESQDIILQVTEVQDLFLVSKWGKAWYELSLVSPTIETILETNEALEEFISHKSSVATAIGAGGVAQMLQVAKAVVEKMDGVGACNRGLMIPGIPQMNKGLSHADIQSVKEVESV